MVALHCRPEFVGYEQKGAPPIAMTPTLQARKQELVRNAIWDAATDLFAEKGFDETTVDDIVKNAGVSRRSFFRYFSSKSDLMAQGLVSYGTALTGAIAACPRNLLPFRGLSRNGAASCPAGGGGPSDAEDHEDRSEVPGGKIGANLAYARGAGSYCGGVCAPAPQGISGRYDAECPRRVDSLPFFAVTFRLWFEQGQQDISVTADQVFTILGRLIRPRAN